MQTALRSSQSPESGAQAPDRRARRADGGSQIPFPFRHFPLRRMQDAGGVMQDAGGVMQDAGGVMQGSERIAQTPEDVLQTAEDGVHFPEDGMQSAEDVTHCADDVNPPLGGGFS